jgi:hypothetical protein
MAAPKKYIKINGVMKKNPEFVKWQAAQNGGPPPPPTNNVALPVVSSMDDHMQMNEDFGHDVPLSESTNATIEMMQEPEICLEAGMTADTMVDELGAVLGKYEVPMGLMNKVCRIECNHGEWSGVEWSVPSWEIRLLTITGLPMIADSHRFLLVFQYYYSSS